jgi:hypothetical protein
VSPCCQAELAQKLSKLSKTERHQALRTIFSSPQVLREAASTWTDALRMALLGAHGYDVTATEFVPSVHTPKNRLILARRIGRFSSESKIEFGALKELLGGVTLHLESLLGSQ